jgi:hypothetical protein
MQSFKQYLTEETQKTVIPQDQVVDYLNAHCKQFIPAAQKGYWICRGSDRMAESVRNDNGLVIDTSNTVRRSAGSPNYYTVFLDYLFQKKYPQFPLRSKSIICTTDYHYSGEFGNTVMVIPEDNSKIGDTLKMDIWDSVSSFDGARLSLTEFNSLVFKMNVKESVEGFKEMSDKLKTTPDTIESLVSDEVKKNFFGACEKYYEGIIEKMKAYTPANFESHNSEVWIGPKAVILNLGDSSEPLYTIKDGKWAKV